MNRLAALALLCAACGADDPEGSPDAARADAAPPADAAPDAAPAPDAAGAICEPAETDYRPGATDTWAPCISDDGLYHRFDESISTIARVGAFERITALLVDGDRTAQDFVDARLIYLEANGLESRVSRREDEHYPPAPMPCNNLTVDELALYPDRCVGPVRIQPLLNAAFQAGAEGDQPAVQAARIEAGLLWFLYVSTYKEAFTCTTTVADCDSHYAYYTGGEPRAGGLGLARYVRALAPSVHDRVWDGILAVRCWRDLDNPTGMAADPALRDRALAQLDRALLRGVAVLVRGRAQALATAAGDALAADWAFLQILGGALDREATLRDPAQATALREALAAAAPGPDSASIIMAAIDALLPCP